MHDWMDCRMNWICWINIWSRITVISRMTRIIRFRWITRMIWISRLNMIVVRINWLTMISRLGLAVSRFGRDSAVHLLQTLHQFSHAVWIGLKQGMGNECEPWYWLPDIDFWFIFDHWVGFGKALYFTKTYRTQILAQIFLPLSVITKVSIQVSLDIRLG